MKTLTKMFGVWCWCICMCTFVFANDTTEKPVQDPIDPPTQLITPEQKLQIHEEALEAQKETKVKAS
jgi:hypothetical protein